MNYGDIRGNLNQNKMTTTLNRFDPKKFGEMITKFRNQYRNHEYPGAKHLTHGVWFSIEQMKEFVDNVLNDQVQRGQPDKQYGIRFYFATYLNDEPHSTPNEPNANYKHRNTLIMVSTNEVSRPDGTTFNEDYFTTYLNMAPENHGELCPEECGEIPW